MVLRCFHSTTFGARFRSYEYQALGLLAPAWLIYSLAMFYGYSEWMTGTDTFHTHSHNSDQPEWSVTVAALAVAGWMGISAAVCILFVTVSGVRLTRTTWSKSTQQKVICGLCLLSAFSIIKSQVLFRNYMAFLLTVGLDVAAGMWTVMFSNSHTAHLTDPRLKFGHL